MECEILINQFYSLHIQCYFPVMSSVAPFTQHLMLVQRKQLNYLVSEYPVFLWNILVSMNMLRFLCEFPIKRIQSQYQIMEVTNILGQTTNGKSVKTASED